ncbi:MAG: glycosyltransferase [Desulfovibrio sp.]|nr:glycosyltransferase [Desulfovibrio sp.]
MSADDLPLSIVATTYNVAPYLRKCLDSVVRQRMPASAYEIIVVDDTSTDGTIDILEEYASRTENMQVVALPAHTPGASGFCLNIGMRMARGKYIGIIDGDDFASTMMYPKMLKVAEETDADLVLCNYNEYLMQSNKSRSHESNALYRSMFTEDFKRLPLVTQKNFYLHMAPMAWRKLFKRSFLQDAHIMNVVNDCYYEDVVFHWFCIVLAERITPVNEVLITHRLQRDGQVMSSRDQRAIVQCMCEHFQTILAFLKKHNAYKMYRLSFYDFIDGFIKTFRQYEMEYSEEAILHSLFSDDEIDKYWKHLESRDARDVLRKKGLKQ